VFGQCAVRVEETGCGWGVGGGYWCPHKYCSGGIGGGGGGSMRASSAVPILMIPRGAAVSSCYDVGF
jgi:hypothetical protein